MTGQRIKKETRVEDRIVDAAVRCFQRYGIAKTTMDDIAKAARVSRPTIYRYFHSRNHLIVEVLVREVRDHTRLVTRTLRYHSYPPTAFVEAVLYALETALEHPYTRIVTSDEGAALLAAVPGSDVTLMDAMAEMWIPTATRWRERGYIRKEINLDDLLLWVTVYMYTTLGPGEFFSITPDRIRRMICTLLVPAVFDFEALKRDFPDIDSTCGDNCVCGRNTP